MHFSTILSSEKLNSLYIEKGCAHGFLTLSKTATVIYLTTSVYVQDSDTGIRWDSFGFDWKEPNLIVSDRDKNFSGLDNFDEE